MALEDTINQPQTLAKEEEDQLSIILNLSKNLIDDGGFEVIEQALSSKDPGQIIGQFLFQMIAQMSEKLPFEPSPNIFFAYGGWVEQISDYLQEEYGVDKAIMDRAEEYIAVAAQQMAQGQQVAAQSPQQSVMPQQGGM